VRDGNRDHLNALLDTLLEGVLGLARERWMKGNDVEARWSQKALTGEVIKPRRIWQARDGIALPVFVAESSTARDSYANEGRLGIGRGRRPVSRVVEWLRRSGEGVALLTNGRQWRLIHAGADYEAWCEWETDLWFEEGVPGPQVTALRILMGESALQAPKQGEPPPLVAAILASRRGQAELSAALGERVRLAVEILIRESTVALSGVDGDGPGQVSRRDMYIAATRLIMRCVVILFAEARDLLPRGQHHLLRVVRRAGTARAAGTAGRRAVRAASALAYWVASSARSFPADLRRVAARGTPDSSLWWRAICVW
jgi:hypothetical protein